MSDDPLVETVARAICDAMHWGMPTCGCPWPTCASRRVHPIADAAIAAVRAHDLAADQQNADEPADRTAHVADLRDWADAEWVDFRWVRGQP